MNNFLTQALRPRSTAVLRMQTILLKDCVGCTLPCAVHEETPPEIEALINRTLPLANTVKPYARHLLVRMGPPSEWPPQLEAVPFIAELTAQLHALQLGYRVLVTATDHVGSAVEESEEEEAYSILALPENKIYSAITSSSILPFLNTWKEEEPFTAQDKKRVMICSHMKRDKRCGVLGPLLVEAFHQALSSENIEAEIMQVSHLGGHSFAGNVLIYPGGYWYGRLNTCHAQNIVREHFKNGKVIKDLLRGTMFDKEMNSN